MNPYIQIIAAFFGSLGFALLFNLRGQWLFFTALGGGLSWCVYLISGSFISHYERQYFAAAFFLGIYSELMARKTKSPSTLYVLKLRIASFQNTISIASNLCFRSRGDEIRQLSAVDVKALQKKVDALSRDYRILDNRIQAANWTADLIEE